jgi:hypothetical protein
MPTLPFGDASLTGGRVFGAVAGAPTSPVQGECHQRVHARLPTRYARLL